MNLNLTRELLAAADEQPDGMLKVVGFDKAHEVELLAKAGFVEASIDAQRSNPVAVIKRVTETGEKLLRVLQKETGEFRM
jgi:hypothetical protein